MLSHFLRTVAADDDPNFRNVTLLLPGNGTNGAQNNTFLDSSTNNFTVTRNGNTTQGTFTPYGSNWSNYFDGAGDFLSAPDNTAFEIGSNSFTVEAWVFLTAYSTVYSGSFYAGTVFGKDSTTSRGFQFNLSGTASSWTGINCLLFSSNTVFTTTSASFTFNLSTWYHLAWVRNGTTVRLYVNGVDIGGGTNSVTVQNSTPAVTVGALNYPSFEYYVPGYISNFRFLNGTALYTTDFTPPTQPLTAITNTSLLTCQSNRLIDNSSNNFTITKNGDVSVQRFSPFNSPGAYENTVIGGSGYFDGTGDYLSVPDNAAYDFGTGDFTVEAWAYHTVSSGAVQVYFSHSTGGIGVSRNNAGALLISQSGTADITNAGSIPLNAWTHVAVSRTGTTMRLFVNGAIVSTVTNSTNFNGTTAPQIGAAGASLFMNGYIADLRVIKGTAQYTAAFTPPTAPLTAVTNTQLLLNYTNAGIIDNAMLNDLETVGNAQISTAQSRFGGSSITFDGSGDAVYAPFAPTLDLIPANAWTFEGWVRPTARASDIRIFATGGGAVAFNATNGIHVLIQSLLAGALNLQVSQNTATPLQATSTATIPLNQWTHIAVSVLGTTAYLAVNGTVTTHSIAGKLRPSTNPNMQIGVIPGEAVGPTNFTGYMDDLRLTYGIARYTADFTPPVRPFPTR